MSQIQAPDDDLAPGQLRSGDSEDGREDVVNVDDSPARRMPSGRPIDARRFGPFEGSGALSTEIATDEIGREQAN